jgi:hypothetical protein
MKKLSDYKYYETELGVLYCLTNKKEYGILYL